MRIVTAIGASILVAAGAMMLARDVLDYRNKAMFVRDDWIDAPKCRRDGCDAECVRGVMIRDLQRRHLHRGMPRGAVSDLLGIGKAISRGGVECLSFEIGMCSGFGIDYDVFIICFDGNSTLTESWTEQH